MAGLWSSKEGRAKQRKEVRKEEGRRPTRIIEKVGRKGVVCPTHLIYPDSLETWPPLPSTSPTQVLLFSSSGCSPCNSGCEAKVVREKREIGDDTREKAARLLWRVE